MFSPYQKEEALRVYDETGSVDQTIRMLGYPTRRCLYGWIAKRDGTENAPYSHYRRPKTPRKSETDRQAAATQAVSRGSRLWTPAEIEAYQQDLLRSELYINIVQETIKLRQKDEPFVLDPLTNHEKAFIADRLRSRYPLHMLLIALKLDRSAYYYHHRESLGQTSDDASIKPSDD